MGSGVWFKSIISLKKSKDGKSKKGKNHTVKNSSNSSNGAKIESLVSPGVSVETIAATRIQTAFRAYKARKSLRQLKGFAKLQILTQGYSVKKQATTTLTYLHSWSKIQAEIRARRICMVTEDRIRRKKLESQLKLEAKLHDLEVEWNGSSDTMEEILARIHQREEAAVKRERTMAYAYTHQWRASYSQGIGNYEMSKSNWGWSWKERWIAARPWESRLPTASISTKKSQSKQSSKVHKDKSPSIPKTPASAKPAKVNAKGSTKARRLSYPSTEKTAMPEEKQQTSGADAKKEQFVQYQA